MEPRTDSQISPAGCQSCAVSFSWTTLVVNALLALLKSVVGVMAGSRALVASALYSVNDVLSSIVVMISMRIARRSPDRTHAYGYGKAEFVAIGLVSTILAGAVVFILTYSVIDILRGVEGAPHLIVLPVAALSMATNQFLARKGFCAAARTRSSVLYTSAEHNRADAVSSLATMIGVGGAALGFHRLDPMVAIFETVHIVWLSGSLFGAALRGLMDAALPEPTVAAVAQACGRVPGVVRVVNLRTRQAGANAWVDVEVQVERGTAVAMATEICRTVERSIQMTLERTIHSRVHSQVKFSAEPVPTGVTGG
jgi:cation diffusion facilitator family transporter